MESGGDSKHAKNEQSEDLLWIENKHFSSMDFSVRGRKRIWQHLTQLQKN